MNCISIIPLPEAGMLQGPFEGRRAFLGTAARRNADEEDEHSGDLPRPNTSKPALEQFLAEMGDLKLANGRGRIVRHGHGPERNIQTGIGPVPVSWVKIRDRGASIDFTTMLTKAEIEISMDGRHMAGQHLR
ncbi:hypothetical protein X744_29530 [Mesorhizobium sp. LNJC372A00]|nr:hypothetical protein X745_28740 [Mesorhizobium sp. LNJC374B00]ESY52252.1 hypothetical protein X744_29530 [Mesorhizobium sp. LNJC372A00]